jgi:hypothetical protein
MLAEPLCVLHLETPGHRDKSTVCQSVSCLFDDLRCRISSKGIVASAASPIMFSSFLGGSSSSNDGAASTSNAAAGTVGQLHPPKERLSNAEATFGPLNPQDTSWLCAGGFTTETQTFYAMTSGKDAKLLMVQVIHSAVG